jgi:LPS export ABC transporter protein LptC
MTNPKSGLSILYRANNARRNLAAYFFYFLLLIFNFYVLQGCKNDPEKIKLLTGKNLFHHDKADDVTMIYSKNGKVKGRLFAHEYIKNPGAKPPYTDLNGRLRVEFFSDSTGELEHLLTADSCRIYDAQQNIVVWGNVQITSTKGEKLNTEELIWNNSIERFFTEKPVKITTGTESLEGTGLEANQDFTWYRILHPKGAVQVKKGEVPQ